MNDILFLLILITLGLMLGTFLKFSMHGINPKLSLFLTIITPFLLCKMSYRSFIDNLKNNPKRIIKSFLNPIINYPLYVSIISEITLEIIASTIVKKNMVIKKEIQVKKIKKVDRKPLITEESLGLKLIIEIIVKTFKKINQTKLKYKAS